MLGIINKGCQVLGISGGEDDTVHAAFNQLFEGFGIVVTQGLDGAIHKLDSYLSEAARFLQDSAPELIVKNGFREACRRRCGQSLW